MVSDKQLEANRANAQKSTGPEEDMEAYNKMTSKLVADLHLVGDEEVQLGHLWASYQRRIKRVGAIEENTFSMSCTGENFNIEHPQAHNATSYAKTFRSDANEFGKLALYGSCLVSQAAIVMKQLHALQAERKKKEQAEMAEAIKIYNAHQRDGATFDPKANGFGFSLEKIKAAYLREERLNPVFVAEKVKQDRHDAACPVSLARNRAKKRKT